MDTSGKCLGFVVALSLLTSTALADVSSSIKTIRAVGAEGEGNAAAARAWDALVGEASADDLTTILAAMDGANPLAVNWLRSAVEAVADKSLKGDGSLPVQALSKFLDDKRHDPRARRLAYELFARVNPAAAKAILPSFLHDPSVEMRRDAVAVVLRDADEALKADRKVAAAQRYGEALTAARDVDQIDHAAEKLRDLGKEVNLPRHFGFIMNWKVVGPFNNADLVGFDAVYPPEKGVDPSATYEGKEGKKVQWIDYTTKDDYGMVDINDALGEMKGVVAYAYTTFHSSEARDAEIRLGCKNAWKLWVNGELAWARDEYHRGMRIDQYTVPITLKQGENAIMIKLCQDERDYSWTNTWQF